ncbi:hypothetical protein MSKU15_1028 [Komagataeibacter diospyri]|uniref:glycosyl hydrolase family 28-related protein n=1 Tax=Komagataeibacter diospyri TaxID=1932662 RepID=UPI00113A3B04|nr:glycosyl hydrolase family 28-related protein [Komagataeibacter diospyri]GCE89427.1 hypothetical protein MSKU15_1028 [Komagataeibacter diospyri]
MRLSMLRVASVAALLCASAGACRAQNVEISFQSNQTLGADALNNVQKNKVSVTNGTATNLTASASTITGGTASGTDLTAAVATAFSGSVSRALSAHLGDRVNVLDFGAKGDGATDNGTAFTNAINAAQANDQDVDFPYSSTGYVVNTGIFPNTTRGRFNFNGNVFSGTALGTPGTGAGTFNSLYTNPWLIVTGTKEEIDPAALSLPSSGSALIGRALECLPNRPNTSDTVKTGRMVACLYIGADTGTGGASGTSYSMELLNSVLNLSSSSGAAQEIDVNFNGKVLDGGVSRGLFITGGGAAGNTTSSVAIDIQHSDYSGGLLPWSTGISIRNSTVGLQTYARSDGTGFLYQGYSASGTLVSQIDNNGYGTFANITGTTLAGTGNAYACINSSGQLYRSSTACD